MPYSYSLACHPAYRTGTHRITVAAPYTSTLLELGISTDGVRYQNHPFYTEVHGDRNGGQQGPPIEKQYLGEIVIVSFTLSTFTAATIDVVRKRGILASNGYNTQDQIGGFMLTNRAMRLCIMPESATDVRNFWCAVPVQAIEVTEGSKFSEWAMTFECHRPPCGHAWGGVLEDKSYGPYAAPTSFTFGQANPPSPITP